MAKNEVVAANQPGAVVTTSNDLPDFLKEQMTQDSGQGVSRSADDNLVPLIYVLQAQSPQCNRRDPDYVEDAEAGSIWLRNSGLPAIRGDEGIRFQPCYFQKDWVEWKPNRGGFAGRHPDKPADAVEKHMPTPQDPDKMAWVLPNGNIVQETRYHIGNVYLNDGRVMPYVIPLTGSGHSVSKAWMFLINSKVIGEKVAPSYGCFYRLKTKQTSNAKGTWMKFDVTDEGWVTNQGDYQRGKSLYEAFAAGEKSIAEDEQETAPGPAMAHEDNAM